MYALRTTDLVRGDQRDFCDGVEDAPERGGGFLEEHFQCGSDVGLEEVSASCHGVARSDDKMGVDFSVFAIGGDISEK